MTQNGKEISMQLVDELFNILNRLVRKAESFGRKEALTTDKSLGKYLYESYLEIIENEVKSKFVNENLNENEFRKIVDGFFIWRYFLRLFFLIVNILIIFKAYKRCKIENLENGCANIFDLSLNHFCQFRELIGLFWF